MKTLTKIALLLLALSVGLHLYLTLQHYPLKLGFSSGPSLCSVNSTFDCDAVSLSAYSTLFGVPLSVWGLIANLAIFGMLLISWLEWSDNSERLKRAAFLMSLTSVGASLVLGVISLTMMKNYCLFCMALYLFSIISSFCIYKTLDKEEPFFKNLAQDIPSYFGESRGILFTLALIPIASLFAHKVFMSNYGAGELNSIIQRASSSWKSSPPQTIDTPPLLVSGPSREEARFVLTEFADLKCSHCKNASQSIAAFTKAHPDVRFEFYVFTLDGACNAAIQRSSGLSCLLSRSIYCAEKQSNQGWIAQKLFFENQQDINAIDSKELLQSKVASLLKSSGIDPAPIAECAESEESLEAIRLQAKQGEVLNIQGTPAFFGNFKKLDYGQLIPVLEAVRKLSPAN